ncbi:Tellurite resistance protein TerB [Octadecabacter temperatus]|uniref:Tellurite resistance protein TerB n=1 Tax=Octadecabacter temperatus TaxID=1458307 RepID=A0A0K0Y7L2_9RHOB|nr:TerB family tellurite resistance protein [Octadecabacter temperatus]AKS46852.1 Tellurite resistance protein TerB [Octadecabacter temperatus]SIO22501.1 Tellurite resistance protein TerB [Octadecabacter temperatus]
MKLLSFIAAVFFVSVIPQKSEAFVYGTDEKMFFHSETEWTDNAGNEMSLCVLRKRYHLMWIAVWSNYSYAVADNRCDTDSLFLYPEEDILKDIASGELTAISSPEVPLNFSRVFWGFTLLIALVPLVLLGLWGMRQTKIRNAKRAELTAGIPTNVQGPLAFLLQAALSDGTADDAELTAITRAVKEIYNLRLTVPQLREIVDNTDVDMEAPEIKGFLASGTGEEKHQALRLLVMVTAADGKLDESELKFAVEAGAKLGFTQADVAQVYKAMSAPAEPQV